MSNNKENSLDWIAHSFY